MEMAKKATVKTGKKATCKFVVPTPLWAGFRGPLRIKANFDPEWLDACWREFNEGNKR